MTRMPLKTTVAALAVIAGAGLAPAFAADYDDGRNRSSYERGYSDRDYSQDTRRRVPDNFDEDRSARHRPDGGFGGQHGIQRVEARGSSGGGYMPYHVKEWRARRDAIDTWKSKVTYRYGQQFAHWRAAEGKQVNCDGAAGSVHCIVSARPQRGWGGWGGWGGYSANR
jgi:hypothetical protein